MPHAFAVFTTKSVSTDANDTMIECVKQFPLFIEGTLELDCETSCRREIHWALFSGFDSTRFREKYMVSSTRVS